MRRNKITGNMGHGLMLDKAAGLYEENALIGNTGDGMYVRNAGTLPEVRRNTIAPNQGLGVVYLCMLRMHAFMHACVCVCARASMQQCI